MPLSRDSLQERQLKAIRRAQFRLRQTLERLQWEEEVLYPEIESLKAGRPVLGLTEGSAFEVVIDDANHHPAQGHNGNSAQKRSRRKTH